MKFYLLFIFFISIFFINCNKSKHKVVDPALSIYVNRFFEEADNRNIDISDNNLEVVFKDLTKEDVCGLGHFQYNGTDLRKVEIMKNFFCWDFHDELGRETLVFHELGHAVLKRSHVNSTLPNGLAATIMCDGNTCDVFGHYDKFTKGKRKYYLDKLFRISAAVPDWGKIKIKATLFFQENFDDNNFSGSFFVSDSSFLTNFSHQFIVNPDSKSKSVQLSAERPISNDVSSSWIINIDQPIIKEGLGLRLSANISSEALRGNGATMQLKVYSGFGVPEISAAATLRNIQTINGYSVIQKYSIELPYYPSDVQYIELVFKLLPTTSGKVNFDNIQLDIMRP